WNSRGPAGPRGIPGPPGVVHGYFSGAAQATAFGTSAITIISHILPSGIFVFNGMVVVRDLSNKTNTITCYVTDGSGNIINIARAILSGSGEQTLAMTGIGAGGGAAALKCSDGNNDAETQNVALTAIPVSAEN